jgi:DNA-binding CsgD family transcriptional regulator
MNTSTKIQERPTIQQKQLDEIFLQGVLEGFVDGVLVLTEQGEILHANNYARQLCRQLTQNHSHPNLVPLDIWQACQALIDSRETYPERLVIMESVITAGKSTAFRIRTRWFKLEPSEPPYILVTLEDQRQSSQSLASLEIHKYGLTHRESQVWLLRRANYSYKEIAAELFISLNTVKKHMRNITAKQEMALFAQELSAVS